MKQHTSGHGQDEASIMEKGGVSFYIIRNLAPIVLEEVAKNNAVIIENKEPDFTRLAVNIIRRNSSPDIYLKPIFLSGIPAEKDGVIDRLTDGKIREITDLKEPVYITRQINTKAKNLTAANSMSFEAEMITRFISLLYTRDQNTMEPVPSAFSNINYAYPYLSENFTTRDEYGTLEILKIAEDEGLIRSEYYDRVYTCSSCSGSHLSYREVCPKCSSSDTVPDDIIHHFPCGYVGPMKDYKNEIDDKLDCPKCNKRLRHIGVDYDKPSVIHECRNCDHQFQDFYVNAKCLSCQADRPVETLKASDIRTYTLTKKGELAAVKGVVTTTKDIEQITGTIKYETFITMLKYEIERLKQTEGDSNICAINIANSSQIYSKLGSELQRSLLKDLVSVIRSNIRSSDVIAFESSSTIVLSMNAIPYKIAGRIMGEMVVLLNDLIRSGFKDLEVQFVTNVVALDYSRSNEAHMKDLIAEFN